MNGIIVTVLFVLLAGAYCQGKSNPSNSTELIGKKLETNKNLFNEDKSIKPMPYSSIVSFFNYRVAVCIGVLFSLKHVLSTNYCIVQLATSTKDVSEEDLPYVRLGSYYPDNDSPKHNIQDLTESSRGHLAVAILEDQVSLTNYVSLIHLSEKDNIMRKLPETLTAAILNQDGQVELTYCAVKDSDENTIKVIQTSAQTTLREIRMGGPLFYGRELLGIASNKFEQSLGQRKEFFHIRISAYKFFLQMYKPNFGKFDKYIHDPLSS